MHSCTKFDLERLAVRALLRLRLDLLLEGIGRERLAERRPRGVVGVLGQRGEETRAARGAGVGAWLIRVRGN